MINANILTIDGITSDISLYIQSALDNLESTEIKIAIGSFTGIKLLSGIGANVTVELEPTGTITTEIKSEFESQGINQTIHRVYLQIECTVNILTPFETIQEEISNQVLLIENVILGQIPSTSLNITK